MLPKILKPFHSDKSNLVRIGPKKDGGYVIDKRVIEKSEVIITCGLNDDWDFEKDFLTVGSMGHCSSIALGIAINKPRRRIICIDGDGSMLMHMGSLASIATLKPDNFYHIIINNGVHDSVGGQDTAAKDIKISKCLFSQPWSWLYLYTFTKFISKESHYYKAT